MTVAKKTISEAEVYAGVGRAIKLMLSVGVHFLLDAIEAQNKFCSRNASSLIK